MIRHTRLLFAVLTGALIVCPALVFQDVLSAQETADVKIKDLKLKVPAEWKQEEPSNNLRLAQFKIDPVKGDKDAAEMVVSSFGGGGGGVDANLSRWAKQFPPEGRKVKVTKGASPQGTYYVSDISGTFNKPDGPPLAGKTKPMAGYRSVSVILQVPDSAVYFLKLTGPEKTVAAATDSLRNSFGGDAEKEEAYEQK